MGEGSARRAASAGAATRTDWNLTAGDFIPTAAPQNPEFAAGDVLAERYEIISLLGKGGMGEVYKAHDLELDRVVALKVILPSLAGDPAILQRFKQEIVFAREITHRNVIRIYDLGESNGIKFVTMEYVEGESLGDILKRREKLPPAGAAALMQQVCEGLAAAHACHIVHRDLKPSNIMCDPEGRVVVMDFGLARDTGARGMTQTGVVLGTVDYMSPEQAKGAAVDARSDLFSIGLIFYQLLTGQIPFHSDSAITTLLKRSQERAAPPSSVDPTIPGALNDIIMRCLEIQAAQRYQTASELLADLQAWREGTAPGASSVVRKLRRNLHWWYAIIFVAVLVVGFAVWLLPHLTIKRSQQPAAVSVLVADFTNHTGDPVFDGTLEPMLNLALEGASFVNGFSRGEARKLARQLPNPTDKLDEQAARLVAVSQGLAAVVTGSLSSRADGYKISVEALDARTGKSIATADMMAADKDAVLHALPKLAAPIRKALGDTTPESAQFDAVSGAFTAASLEAVHQDAIGMEQQFAGNFEEAFKAFSRAAELDPNFARAYSGMAAMAENLGKAKDAETYIKLAMEHQDRMTERERYRNRGLFYATRGDWQKCVDEYTQLVTRYPADRIGQLNLASCLAQLRNLPKAVEAARRAVEIVPKGAFQRLNLSFLSSFSGDFQGGEREARAALQLNPSSEVAYVMLAEAQLGQGQVAEAAQSYRQLEKVSELGASMAATGLADLALYEGRFSEAAQRLDRGATADVAGKMPDAAANKFTALAYTQLWRQQKGQAIVAAEKALANSQAVTIRFLAARIFVEAGEAAKARKLAASLGSELQAEPQAYAKIIQGKAALRRGNVQEAIKAFTEGNNLLDTWIGRFELGRAYLEAGAFVEADSEFDRCVKRHGEALEFFMDDVPTYGYFPPVYYYQGRVREGLKSPNFVESYRTYLTIRGKGGEDPLLAEVRKRVGR